MQSISAPLRNPCCMNLDSTTSDIKWTSPLKNHPWFPLFDWYSYTCSNVNIVHRHFHATSSDALRRLDIISYASAFDAVRSIDGLWWQVLWQLEAMSQYRSGTVLVWLMTMFSLSPENICEVPSVWAQSSTGLNMNMSYISVYRLRFCSAAVSADKILVQVWTLS